ncbi:MAG: hypothetical protein VB041_11145 [Candidatus Limiplasma sp.]|nr:hypothetical protein [Candidatus Limiplasma sp.]
MPYHNYCKKCNQEVPVGEVCSHCGAKLTRSGERLSWTVERKPVQDFFCWNAMLRVVVPVTGLVLGVTILLEALAEGANGVQNVFLQGFFWLVLLTLGILLALTWLILLLQGKETVHCVLDSKGVHTHVYLLSPKPLRLYARFTTPQAAFALACGHTEGMGEDYLCIRRTDTAWGSIRRYALWPETGTIILYSPSFWSVAHLRCPSQEAYGQALAYVHKKAPKTKRTPIKQKKQR